MRARSTTCWIALALLGLLPVTAACSQKGAAKGAPASKTANGANSETATAVRATADANANAKAARAVDAQASGHAQPAGDAKAADAKAADAKAADAKAADAKAAGDNNTASEQGSPQTSPDGSASTADSQAEGTTDQAANAEFAWPALLDNEGSLLPQTEEQPSTEAQTFVRGGQLLFDAIVADDAELALPFFFPKAAYEQVKAIADPAKDWEGRLLRLFRRDIHTYHRQLGRYRDQARFLRIEVHEPGVKWMKPHTEGNAIGYYRVLRSILFYEDHQGRERQLGITAFISWRGHWYVVHVDGVK